MSKLSSSPENLNQKSKKQKDRVCVSLCIFQSTAIRPLFHWQGIWSAVDYYIFNWVSFLLFLVPDLTATNRATWHQPATPCVPWNQEQFLDRMLGEKFADYGLKDPSPHFFFDTQINKEFWKSQLRAHEVVLLCFFFIKSIMWFWFSDFAMDQHSCLLFKMTIFSHMLFFSPTHLYKYRTFYKSVEAETLLCKLRQSDEK